MSWTLSSKVSTVTIIITMTLMSRWWATTLAVHLWPLIIQWRHKLQQKTRRSASYNFVCARDDVGVQCEAGSQCSWESTAAVHVGLPAGWFAGVYWQFQHRQITLCLKSEDNTVTISKQCKTSMHSKSIKRQLNLVFIEINLLLLKQVFPAKQLATVLRNQRWNNSGVSE